MSERLCGGISALHNISNKLTSIAIGPSNLLDVLFMIRNLLATCFTLPYCSKVCGISAVVKLLNAVNIVFSLNILASWFSEGVMLYLQEEKYGFVRCGCML